MRQKLEAAIFSASEIAAMKAALRDDWIALLKSHLLANKDGGRTCKDDLLSFDGLVVVVKTKTKHYYGHQFYLADPERLIVFGKDRPKFKPRWETIGSIEFRYVRPPRRETRASLPVAR